MLVRVVRGSLRWMVPVALIAAALVPTAAAHVPGLAQVEALASEGAQASALGASVSAGPDEATLQLFQEWMELNLRTPSGAAFLPDGEPSVPSGEQGARQSPVARQARTAVAAAAAQTEAVQSEVAQQAEEAQAQVASLAAALPQDPLGFATGAAQAATGAASALPVLFPAPSMEPQSGGATPVVPDPGQGLPPLLAGSILVAGAAGATFFAFWLAGSSGTAATGAAAAAKGSELRRLLPFASPLFTRFEKDTVLGHPRREALYALILQQPGISLQSLGESTGLSRTAVLHHLRLLEMQHLVVSKRMGRSRHYYENGGRYGRDAKEAYAVLQNARSKEVAEFIRTHPGAMQKQLCEALAIQPSIAHWHVRRLQAARLVECVRHGRAVNYFPGTSLLEVAAQPPIPPAPPALPELPAPAPLPLATLPLA